MGAAGDLRDAAWADAVRGAQAAIPNISDAVLSDRLKELEASSIVRRTVEPSTPVRIQYALTPRGEQLAAVLGELQVWAERWSREAVRA